MHSEELHDLYVSLNIIRVIESGSMGWVGHVARISKMKYAYKSLVGNPQEKRPFR